MLLNTAFVTFRQLSLYLQENRNDDSNNNDNKNDKFNNNKIENYDFNKNENNNNDSYDFTFFSFSKFR